MKVEWSVFRLVNTGAGGNNSASLPYVITSIQDKRLFQKKRRRRKMSGRRRRRRR